MWLAVGGGQVENAVAEPTRLRLGCLAGCRTDAGWCCGIMAMTGASCIGWVCVGWQPVLTWRLLHRAWADRWGDLVWRRSDAGGVVEWAVGAFACSMHHSGAMLVQCAGPIGRRKPRVPAGLAHHRRQEIDLAVHPTARFVRVGQQCALGLDLRYAHKVQCL